MSLTEIPIVKGRVFNRNLNVGVLADGKGPGDTVTGLGESPEVEAVDQKVEM